MEKSKKEIKADSLGNFLVFIDTHRLGEIQLTDEVSYTTIDIIKNNILDRNFQFSVPYYSDGTEKLFFSVPFILADATYRNTNLDSKDIQVKSDNIAAMGWIPLIRGALKGYLKDSYFDIVMNDIRKELIDMGHVITKEVFGETKIVSLLNIVRPVEIMDLQDGGLAEATYPTWKDMLINKEAWKDAWKEVEMVHDVAESQKRKTYKVYEWWTEDYFEVNGEMKWTKGCIKYLDATIYDSEISEMPENWTPVVELERFATPYERVVKDKARKKRLKAAGLLNKDKEPCYPYSEQRLYKIPGRWMGMGYYELLRNEGKAFQRTLNEKIRYDELLHKGVLVHTKAPFTANQKGSGRGLEADIINRIQTGTMISIKAGERIDRLNLGSLTADFLATADKWFELARQKVGVSETSLGERTPSSSTATVAVINEKQSKNAFDIVNEQQGIFFRELFTEFKIEEILNNITEDEWVKIVGDPDELAEMEEAFIENLVNQKVSEAATTGKFVPTGSTMPPEQLEEINAAVRKIRSKQGEERFAQIQKEMIKDFDFFCSFVITNESFDKQVVLNSIQEAINTVAQNPMSEIDMDKLVEMKFDLMEVNAANLRKSPEKIQAEREMAMAEAQGDAAVNPRNPQAVEGEAKNFGQINQQRA